jgi:hypothetical protein
VQHVPVNGPTRSVVHAFYAVANHTESPLDTLLRAYPTASFLRLSLERMGIFSKDTHIDPYGIPEHRGKRRREG